MHRFAVYLPSTLLFFAASVCLADTQIDFNRDIRPILSENCFRCHGPDEASREGELRLDQKTDVLTRRDGYSIVEPGSPEKSELFARISARDADQRMPPADSGKELTVEQISLLKRWIAAGANWQEHWSFIPPKRPPVPHVQAADWPLNPIDQFIAHRLQEASLQSEPTADRRTLVRRLCLDLTGLPPTREQVQEFLDDTNDGAYERLVNRLLQSPQFGERMTVAWLDQARYADTNGYSIDGGRHMWLWRDWVINAYNQNMPFDQFVVEQLAGDLLPSATTDQRVASGFNRNHMITHEGGTIPEENLVNYVVDRVRTTSEVFLGLTMGCAQCHDHKYDPINQRDFYRFFAYFNTIDDRGLDGDSGVNATPKIRATSILHRSSSEADSTSEADQVRAQLAELEQIRQMPLASQADWETQTRREIAELGKDLKLVPLEVVNVSAPNRQAKFEIRDDDTLLLVNGAGRSPSILCKLNQAEVTGLRLEFLPDTSFPQGGLGYGTKAGLEGSLLLTSFSVSATETPAEQVDLYHQAPIRAATATAAHADYPVGDCLIPYDTNGWSPGAAINEPQSITFQFAEPIKSDVTPYVTLMLVWGGGHNLSGGLCRLYSLSGNNDQTNIPQDVQTILKLATAERSPEQQQRLRSYYASVAPELADVRYRIENLREWLAYLTDEHEVMVMNTAEKPRETHILNRGQYDQLGELVTPGTPASLPQPAADYPTNRLGLARWLVHPDHPLTARVAVNRLWQLFFGRGIVTSSADFGSQGQPPTHPELLDWLAREFVESGWDVKHMVKLMVTSATYRQSSATSAEKLKVDPYNQLLSRGPRYRLSAEFVRDSVLQTSGLLVTRLGGPSVRPYQPPNLWREVSHFGSSPATSQAFVQDHGEGLYRRSMYTYWKRTVPPPSMVSFDAPNRETCTVQRARTNTPLQALVLLNDPQYVEASRAFAERILQSSNSTDERIRFAFQEALTRPPTSEELAIVRETVFRELRRFSDNPQAATELLSVGESQRNAVYRLEEHAAWTTVANLIFNLSEMITKG